MRYKAELSYLGTNYHGWQKQPNAITVQQTIEDAFELLFKDKIEFVGCGRTDTGVHASNYVAHFDSENIYNENTVYKLNKYLPFDIAFLSIQKKDADFHARFSAKSRTYEYIISLKKNPFKNDSAWVLNKDLDVEQMQKAANLLFNYSDFTSFSKLHTDVKTNNCKIYKAKFELKDKDLIFIISADRFLRNMVRAIVGTLVEVGKNKITIEDFCKIIEQKNRGAAGQSAPAKGLYLVEIEY